MKKLKIIIMGILGITAGSAGIFGMIQEARKKNEYREKVIQLQAQKEFTQAQLRVMLMQEAKRQGLNNEMANMVVDVVMNDIANIDINKIRPAMQGETSGWASNDPMVEKAKSTIAFGQARIKRVAGTDKEPQ